MIHLIRDQLATLTPDLAQVIPLENRQPDLAPRRPVHLIPTQIHHRTETFTLR
jgi:hypothetical protein